MHGMDYTVPAKGDRRTPWLKFQWSYAHRYWLSKAAWHRATGEREQMRFAFATAQWCRAQYIHPKYNRKIA